MVLTFRCYLKVIYNVDIFAVNEQVKNLINDNSSNTLADNCQYWIGEIYYKLNL